MFLGTRVPVCFLFDYLRAGESIDVFLREYPSVPKDIALAALNIAEQLTIEDVRKKTLPLSDKELEALEATRDLYAELKQAIKQMQAGLGRIAYPPIILARKNTGLSHAEFADLLSVSVQTLEDWEQQRQQLSGAALSLLAIARDSPEALFAVKAQK